MNNQFQDFYKMQNPTLIVLGNGFDLHCKLPTSYFDFFATKKDEYSKIDEVLGKIYNHQETPKPPVNIWDAFFAFNKNLFNPNWSDIECLISSSLDRENMNSIIHWEPIAEAVCFKHPDMYLVSLNESEKKLSDYIRCFFNCSNIPYNNEPSRKRNWPFEKRRFYYFLSKQLEEFEKNFGTYIKNIVSNSCEYIAEAQKTITLLLKKCNIHNPNIIVDTFNYTDFSLNSQPILHHINGNADFPIFGIDSEGVENNRIDSTDPCSFFTKDVRRIGNNTCGSSIPFVDIFNNVIFFGSSLSVADYFYFFSIIDEFRKKWEGDHSSKKLFFLYSTSYEIDDSKKRLNELLYIGNVRKLFQSYAEYSGIIGANRFFGLHYNQGDIVIKSID